MHPGTESGRTQLAAQGISGINWWCVVKHTTNLVSRIFSGWLVRSVLFTIFVKILKCCCRSPVVFRGASVHWICAPASFTPASAALHSRAISNTAGGVGRSQKSADVGLEGE